MDHTIPFEFEVSDSTGIKLIAPKTLLDVCPEAYDSLPDWDPDAPYPIWVMVDRPEPDPFDDEKFTETNEPELGEWLAEVWDKVAVDIDGFKFVILCGSEDDESGWYWSANRKRWESYMF